MSITNLQQARQMYAMGQRVAKTLDGSRPGYRGPGGYQGSSTKSKTSSSKSKNTSKAGNQNTGNDREDYRANYSSKSIVKGGGTKKPGGGYNDARVTGDQGRSARRDFIQTLNNNNAIRANQTGTKFTPYQGGSRPKPRSGLGGLLMGALGMFMGIPGLGLLAGGLGNLKGKLGDAFGNFNRKMRGVNPDGTTRTQLQYEQAMYDRRQQNRVAKLLEARNRGYNQIGFGNFTKKTMDFTEGQQAKLDDLIAKGYGPTSLDNPNPTFQNDLGNPNMNLNDIQSIVAASQMPQRFLPSGAAGNTSIQDISTMEMNDAQLAKMAAEGASPQIMAEVQNRLDRARANESAAYKGVAQGFAGEDIQPQEGIMSYPSDLATEFQDMAIQAKVSPQDIARYSQQKDLINQQPYEDAMGTTLMGSEMTPYEFENMKKGNITQPGVYQKGYFDV